MCLAKPSTHFSTSWNIIPLRNYDSTFTRSLVLFPLKLIKPHWLCLPALNPTVVCRLISSPDTFASVIGTSSISHRPERQTSEIAELIQLNRRYSRNIFPSEHMLSPDPILVPARTNGNMIAFDKHHFFIAISVLLLSVK